MPARTYVVRAVVVVVPPRFLQPRVSQPPRFLHVHVSYNLHVSYNARNLHVSYTQPPRPQPPRFLQNLKVKENEKRAKKKKRRKTPCNRFQIQKQVLELFRACDTVTGSDSEGNKLKL